MPCQTLGASSGFKPIHRVKTTLRSTTNTSKGQTISFCEGVAYGGSDVAQLVNVAIVGGGTIRNTAPGSNENAIGFSRVKNYSVVGMIIPQCNRKAITAQIGCDGGIIRDNRIGSANEGGGSPHGVISIEFGSSHGGGSTENIISGNIIESAPLANGVHLTYVSGGTMARALVTNNVVLSSGLSGFYYSGVTQLISTGNISVNAGYRGFQYHYCDNVISTGDMVMVPQYQGVYLDTCGQSMMFSNMNIKDPSQAGPGLYDAFYIKEPTGITTLNNIVETGANTRYGLNGETMGTAFPIITGGRWINDINITTFNPSIVVRAQLVGYAATITPDYAKGATVYVEPLTGNIMINPPINMAPGQQINIRLPQDGPGGRTITFGTNMVLTGSLTTTGNTVSLVQFEYDGAKWRGHVVYTGQAI